MTPSRFRWGMLLVLLGLWLLGYNLGYFTDSMWDSLTIFIPVALIAIGVEKIFTKSLLQFISYLSTIALFFTGLLLAFGASLGSGNTSLFGDTTYFQRDDPDVERVRADLDLKHTSLTIRDSGDDLVWAYFERYTRTPQIDFEIIRNEANITMASKEHSYLGGAVKIKSDEPQEWRLRFSDRLPVTLRCNAEDSDLHLNFATTRLRELSLDIQDTRVYLKLGDNQPESKVQIRGSDGTLQLRIPETVGIHVQGDTYRDLLQHLGMTRTSFGYSTPGYDTLSSKVELELDPDLGSVSIDVF